MNDFQKAVEAENLFYPPDPTEWSCQIGGTVATNASGARSFKYGATQKFCRTFGNCFGKRRNFRSETRRNFSAKTVLSKLKPSNGNEIKVKLPTYEQPNVRKNTSGYFSGEKIDAIDLFIGSEGTLGIITEIEIKTFAKTRSIF